VGRHVYDKITGEHYGEYTISVYTPEPITYTKAAPKSSREHWRIEDDGTVAPIDVAPPQQNHLPCVIEHPPSQLSKPSKQSSLGRNPQHILNPLAAVLYTLNLEQHPTPWLDDIAFGAIYTGPGVINGKQSVSLEDVMLVLRLPIITTAAAAERLSNHDRKPMCSRQIQRVVEAARIALRGLALYLERHPHIAQSLDMAIDFDKLWAKEMDHTGPTKNSEHPRKQAALIMIRSKTPKKTIAKELGISKNTVKKWYREIDIELDGGGQSASINDR
jgi:hypothetical protein